MKQIQQHASTGVGERFEEQIRLVHAVLYLAE
jgi:hypothetical protein